MAYATYEESAFLWRLTHVNDSKNHSGSTAPGKMVSGIGVEAMASTTLLTATKSAASEGLDASTGHVHPLHWGVKTGQCFKTLCRKHRHFDMLRCSLLGGSWWSPLIPDTCTSHQKSSAPMWFRLQGPLNGRQQFLSIQQRCFQVLSDSIRDVSFMS